MKWYAQKGYRKRSAAEATRALVWDRWGEGLPMVEIASTLQIREQGCARSSEPAEVSGQRRGVARSEC
jgi:hypothetical protein